MVVGQCKFANQRLKASLGRMGFIAFFALSSQTFVYANIFDHDDRVVIRDLVASRYPGLLYLENGCSAALVGPKTAVTAAHCLKGYAQEVGAAGAEKGKISILKPIPVFAGRIGKKSLARARVVRLAWGSPEPEKNRDGDWAVMQLDQELGRFVTPFRVALSLPDSANAQWVAVGYSSDLGEAVPSAHSGCTVHERREDRTFLTDCDSMQGSSGGPILECNPERCRIVGIQVAEYRDGSTASMKVPKFDLAHANVAVSSENFVERVREFVGW